MKKLFWVLALMLVSASAHGAESMQTTDYGKFYLGVGAGAAVPQDTSLKISGAITGSGNLSYKAGPAVMGMGGYRFTNYLTGEAEFGYSSVDYDKISGTLSAGSLGTGSGEIGVRGHASAVVGLFNAIVTPMGAKGSVSPYFGGGVGFAATDSKVDSLSFGGSTATVSSSHSETDLAWDAVAGADVALGEHVSLGGRYQFVWIDSGSSASGGGVTGKSGNFGAHVVTAQATYRF